jgi:homoserine O-acetyltransferase
VLLPFGPETRGHGTHTVAKVWEAELAALLAQTAR